MTLVEASRQARAVPRAEPVGSLLRNPEITARIDRLYADQTAALRPLVLADRPAAVGDLNRAADATIPDLVRRQIDAGLDVVTDGEVRRPSFLSTFYDAVEGFEAPDERMEVRDADGNVVYSGLNDPVVAGRIRKLAGPAAEEAAYMRAVTAFPFKITLPAPSYYYTDFMPVRGGGGYASKHDFVQDAAAITKQIVAEAIGAGARWIQFDFPVYPALVAERTSDHGSMIDEARGDGMSDAELLDQAIAVDRAVVEDVPEDVTVALHLCRGNLPGGFWSGSLEPIAERLLGELPHGRFLFEWEDLSREGDYSPIRYVPKGKVMVMGVVSTKTPELEGDDEIVRRIEEASKHLDIDQLAITSQCGFASIYADHLVEAEDAQWRKLELIGRVADRVWGSS